MNNEDKNKYLSLCNDLKKATNKCHQMKQVYATDTNTIILCDIYTQLYLNCKAHITSPQLVLLL